MITLRYQVVVTDDSGAVESVTAPLPYRDALHAHDAVRAPGRLPVDASGRRISILVIKRRAGSDRQITMW